MIDNDIETESLRLKIRKNYKEKYMITPDHNNKIWYKVEGEEWWSIVHGAFDIKLEEDGKYYSYHEKVPKEVAVAKNCLYFTPDFVEKVFEDFKDDENLLSYSEYELYCYKLDKAAEKILSKRKYLMF